MSTSSPVIVAHPMAPVEPRRRSPRLQLLGEVHGTLVGMAVPATVRDLSDGGFSIECVLQFPKNAPHLFQLAFGPDSDSAVVARARAVHSQATPGPGSRTFITGFAFTEDQPHTTHEAIAQVVASARDMIALRGESAGAERRETERLDVLGEMQGEVLSIGAPLLVRDFGLGGCSIETHAALEVGQEYPVRLDLSDSLSVSIRASVVHARRESEDGRPPRFVSGLRFVDPAGQSRREIGEMLGLLTSTVPGR